MGSYDYNKGRYVNVMLRIRKDDIDTLDWLKVQKSINASITDLIHSEVERLSQSPTVPDQRPYELIEEKNGTYQTLAEFDSAEDAFAVLIDVAGAFEDTGKLYIVERIKGKTLTADKSIDGAEVIKTFTRRMEENEK